MTSPNPAARVVPSIPLSNDEAVAFLTVCADYFERRPTDGEDAVHWSNVSNGRMCRKIAAMLSAAPAPASGVDAVAVEEGARQIYEKYRARGFVEDGDETAPWDDAQPSIQRAFVELANLRAIVHATGEARDAAGYLGSAEDCIRQLSADAEAWHRVCETIATVLGLPLPEADFANVVRDWSERHTAQLAEIEEMLSDGQGDDDGPQILPDFEPGWSTVAKVEACLHLLEKRRDALMERDEP